jgi:hypothetical protein
VMSEPFIQLTRYDIDPRLNKDKVRAYPLTIRAKGFNGAPSEIFIYHRLDTVDPYNGDVFEAVATPIQIEELPLNCSAEFLEQEQQIPFYRKDLVELYTRSLQEAEYIWEEIKDQTKDFIQNFRYLNDLVGVETVEVGTTIQNIADYGNSKIFSVPYQPATDEELTDKGEVKTYSQDVKGWIGLDACDVSLKEKAPKNAKLVYNLKADPEIEELFESTAFADSHMELTINSVMYPRGENGVYEITKDGIFWLDFSNTNLPAVFPTLSLNPWPKDYFVGVGSTRPNIIKLYVYG